MNFSFYRGRFTLPLFLFFLSFLFSENVFSQYTLSGRVVDAETGKKLGAVNISIVDESVGASTDEDGFFLINEIRSGKPKINVSHINYLSSLSEVNFEGKTKKEIIVYLIPKTIELNQIIVTSRHTHTKFDEYKEEINILEGKELHKNLNLTIASTLKNEVGIAMRSMGPAPARPVIRGLGGDRVLFTEDGTKAIDLSATSPDHALTIDPFFAERIEVIRGPEVLLKSSSTLGGVVNIVRHDIPVSLFSGLRGLAGSYYEYANSGILGAAQTEYGVSNFLFRGSILRRTASDVKSPSGTLKNSYSSNFNYALGGTYVDDFGYAGYSFKNFSLDYGVPGGFVGAHPNGVDISVYRDQYSVKSSINVSKTNNIVFDFARTFYRHKEFEKGGLLGAEFRIVDYSGFLNYHSETGNFPFIGGISFESRESEAGGYVFTPNSHSLNIAGYYFQGFQFGKLNGEAAVRFAYDKITPDKEKNSLIGYIRERDFAGFSWSMALIYPLSVLNVGLNISQTSRVPTLEELYSEGPHLAAYSYETGNPDLQRENGHGFEAFLFSKSENAFGMITLFYYSLNNYIIPRNTGMINYQTFLPVYSTTNVDAILKGIEISTEYKPIYNFDINLSMSYTVGEFKNKKGNMPQIPPAKFNFEMRYNFERISVGVELEGTLSQNVLDEFEEATAGYLIAGVYTQSTFAFAGLVNSVSLVFDNIFNKEYRNHLSRVKSILPEQGRSFRLIYKAYF